MSRSFYTTLKQTRTPEGLSVDLKFHADHPLYGGHFPNNPITPGVCLVQSINDQISSCFGNVRLTEVKKCRFTAIHNPNVHPQVLVEINVSEIESGYKISASIKHEDEVFVKYSATFE